MGLCLIDQGRGAVPDRPGPRWAVSDRPGPRGAVSDRPGPCGALVAVTYLKQIHNLMNHLSDHFLISPETWHNKTSWNPTTSNYGGP